jgi:hypothetical protein
MQPAGRGLKTPGLGDEVSDSLEQNPSVKADGRRYKPGLCSMSYLHKSAPHNLRTLEPPLVYSHRLIFSILAVMLCVSPGQLLHPQLESAR